MEDGVHMFTFYLFFSYSEAHDGFLMRYTVVTSSKSSGIGNGLTYELNGSELTAGQPVRVPLRNTLVEGIVLARQEAAQEREYDVKQISEILGSDPLLSPAALNTVSWMSSYYCCSLRQALGVWLPPVPWSNALPRDAAGFMLANASVPVTTAKQQAVVDALLGREWMSRSDLVNESGASPAVLRTLLKKGVLREERRRPEPAPPVNMKNVPLLAVPTLSPAQEAVYESMTRDERPSLLFGITGSGKTEIYARMIASTVLQGKQAILLLPEILLTENFIERFEKLLRRDSIAMIHSRLTPAQRRSEWQRIHGGEVSLVIGSRSALFSPLRNPGLVILDEEHEWTYKNEQAPRYHARETAETYCRFAKAKLVLGSATPSLESWARAKSDRYHLARLPMRYGEQPLPDVRLIDLADAEFGNAYPLTQTLIAAIKSRLEKKEQSVLFLNRRGVATALLCLQCRRRVICPDSQLPYSLHHTHSGRPYLLDHTTGMMADVPAECPHCHSTRLHSIGAGTQRIELLLQKIFPSARIIRADSDTIQHPEEIRTLLRKMRQNEADILLGTQSVVKGLDLPNVTLAAVLVADVGLSLPHFRAGERIFQLLTQLTGRSGRAKPGEVLIQTFRPEAPEIMAAAKHETEKYMENELKMRIYGGYPPASTIVRLIARGDDAERHAKKAYVQASAAMMKLRNDIKVTVAPTLFGGGKIWHVLLRGADPQSLLGSIDLKNVAVDVDPVETV